nr:hypothetical protein [Pedobacter panaciterrae]
MFKVFLLIGTHNTDVDSREKDNLLYTKSFMSPNILLAARQIGNGSKFASWPPQKTSVVQKTTEVFFLIRFSKNMGEKRIRL